MYLFDTNVLSEVIRKRPNPSLLKRLADTPGHLQYTSCICVMELRYGASRRVDSSAFWRRIERDLLSLVQVLPINYEIAIIAGDTAARMAAKGRTVSPEDLLIASTAIRGDMLLVSANVRHFRDIDGLRIENWLE